MLMDFMSQEPVFSKGKGPYSLTALGFMQCLQLAFYIFGDEIHII